MERTRDYRRKKNYSKAMKRKKFCENAYGFDWYEHLGQYIKGKIHCSCPLCSAKSKRNGYKPSDLRKIESYKNQISEYV